MCVLTQCSASRRVAWHVESSVDAPGEGSLLSLVGFRLSHAHLDRSEDAEVM